MRELFIYYRVRPENVDAALTRARALQDALRIAHPALRPRLLRRSDTDRERETWMETYSTDPARAPAGVDPALQAAIAVGMAALLPLLDGARHAEAFDTCAS